MERLKRLRTDRNLSQARLAAKAGLDPSTVNQIERGVREASPATLRKLADALEIGLYELLEEDSPKGERRSSLEPSFNDVLEDERRVAELEEIRQGYRASSAGLERYCARWEKRIVADDLDRRAAREFLQSAGEWMPVLIDSLIGELRELMRVGGFVDADELRDRSMMQPVADRYIALRDRIQEIWRQRFDGALPAGAQVIDLQAKVQERLARAG